MNPATRVILRTSAQGFGLVALAACTYEKAAGGELGAALVLGACGLGLALSALFLHK